MPDIDIPAPFDGTPAELEANRRSHDWMQTMDDGIRCARCDCRFHGGTSMWPCGDEKRLSIPAAERDTPETQALLEDALVQLAAAVWLTRQGWLEDESPLDEPSVVDANWMEEHER